MEQSADSNPLSREQSTTVSEQSREGGRQGAVCMGWHACACPYREVQYTLMLVMLVIYRSEKTESIKALL